MKKIVIAALAASAACIAAPAAAQSADATGTVNITGSVGDKCIVVTSGGAAGQTFGGTVALGDLAAADGTLATDLETRFNAAGNNAALQARVVCTTAAPKISVNADPITAQTNTAPANSGYDDSVDFQANVALTTVGQNNGPFSNDSASAPGASAAIGSRLANSATNVVITATNFRTSALSDLLVADPSYKGTITVVISPI